MKRLLVAWHSLTGAAGQMAAAAAEGARATQGIEVRLRAAADTDPADILAADGYLFVAPETLGSVSGGMKDLFDRCYYPALDRIHGRPYALLVAAGTDGSGAVRQMARILTGWRLRAVAEPLILRNGAATPAAILAPKTLPPDDLARCRDLGAALAEGLALGVF